MPHTKNLTVKTLILSASLLAGASAAVSAKTLRDEPLIDNSMLRVALALEISEKCDSLSARKLKGLNYLWGLKSKASKMGYSDDEIRAYVDSKSEKTRMRARGEAYVKAAGFNPALAEDLCALGRQEISKDSLIGSFLRSAK
jgi:hypothetical protein